MLAYVFWHRPAPDAGAAYEPGLRAFQAVLREAPPAGFVACWTYAVEGDAYEDWYLVDDWAALGVLNDAAVDAGHRVPHDAVAALAADGIAGVFRLIAGDGERPRAVRTTLAKPAGVSYAEFAAAVVEPAAGNGAAVWQRQMTLGPGPEFRVYGDEAASLEAPCEHAPLRLV